MSETYIKHVTELAKYQVGDFLYRVVFRPIGIPDIILPPEDDWMLQAHPQVLFDYGIADQTWKFQESIPKLCALDFQAVVSILTSEPVVERFEVSDIFRSQDTGEFYYGDSGGDWMPERAVWDDPETARTEKLRIKGLFRQWSCRYSRDEA